MIQLSVIIPAYNGDRYIAEAIDSALEQTYSDEYEIIIVDDGSTDNTFEVVEQYDNRVNYLSQKNQGVAASRNLGLAAARGKYIAFLDQDDLFLPHKLSSQVALLERDSGLGMVNSGWQIIDELGVALSAVQPWQQIPDLSCDNLIVWKPVFLGAMLFRRSWLERAKGFNTALQQTPDVDLVMRLAMMGCTAAWVEQITVKYRQHRANASRNSLLQTQELNQITAKFFDRSNLPPQIKALEARSRYESLIWSAWRLQQTGYLAQMSDYLYQSQSYSQKYPTETVLNWIESFKNYSFEYGNKFDVAALTSSGEWQDLIAKSLLHAEY